MPLPSLRFSVRTVSVGFYQVNMIVPATQNALPFGGAIMSNLTLTIVGLTSFDGAGICVATAASATEKTPAAAVRL